MKAWFIFKNGEPIGNITGYTNENGAIKALNRTDDYKNLRVKYPFFIPKEKMTEELKNTGIYYEGGYYKEAYICSNKDWVEKIWEPFVKQNIQIIEKEFEIVFKN